MRLPKYPLGETLVYLMLIFFWHSGIVGETPMPLTLASELFFYSFRWRITHGNGRPFMWYVWVCVGVCGCVGVYM